MKKPKLREIETMRGLAFLAVVLQHAIGHYTFASDMSLADGVMLGIFLLAAKFAVPLFLYITGLVLFYNYEGSVRYGEFLRKRWRDILLPYLIWVVLYAIVNLGLRFASWDDVAKLLLAALTGTASYHLWYIVMIVQFYLLFPLLRSAANRWKPVSGKIGIAWLTLLGLAYIGLMRQKGAIYDAAESWRLPIVSDWLTTYMDRNALFFFFYFVLGAASGMYPERWKAWLVRYRPATFAAFAAMFLYMLYQIVAHFQLQPGLAVQYNDTLLLRPAIAVFLIISVLALHAWAVGFSAKAPLPLQRLIAAIGSYSYTAYLAHAFVLVAAVWLSDSLLPGTSVTVRTLLSFLFCAAGSVLVSFLLRIFQGKFRNG